LTANKIDDAAPDELTDLSDKLFQARIRQQSDFGRRREGPVVLPPLPSWSERMGLTALFGARSEAQGVFARTGTKPKLLVSSHFSAVREDLVYAVKLMRQEQEILVFAGLQWLVIGLAYLLWIEVIASIPPSVWTEVNRALDDDQDAVTGLAGLALWAWTLLIIITVAYPIALLNASIAAAHYLRASQQTSTIGRCLQLAFGNMGRLWLFTAMDAYVTVNAIIDRMPRKRGRRTALEEATYYAWKVGTAGVLPSLVAGNSFVMAAKESVRLLEDQPVRTIAIRMAYSLLCWIVGVVAYVGTLGYFMAFGAPLSGENMLYHFYVLVGMPVMLAAGVACLLRPVFVVAVTKLYTDVIPVNVEGAPSIAEAEHVVDLPVIVFVVALGFLVTLYLSY
jgi:hypothetical protein